MLLWVCIMEIGCYLSQSIRLPRLSACVAMGMYKGDRMLFVAVDPIAEVISVCCYGYVLRR